ncbi:MAG: hypothetical protein ACRCX8_19515 [Sarcina sp.]
MQQYIPMGISIILSLIIIGLNYFLKKDSNMIKSKLPQAKCVANEVLKGLNDAGKIDKSLFPNSVSNQTIGLVTDIVESGIKKLDTSNLNSKSVDNQSVDNFILQASEVIKAEFDKYIDKNNIKKDKPLG